MARRALEAGVTTARSGGSPANLDVALSAAIAAGQVPGPQLLAAGPTLTITGGHGWLFGREADGELEFVKAVRANVRDGAGRHQDRVERSGDAGVLCRRRGGGQPGELQAVVREARAAASPGPEPRPEQRGGASLGPGGRGQRGACVPGGRSRARHARRDRHDARPDPDRDRRLEEPRRPDRRPAGAPGRDRAAPPALVRDGRSGSGSRSRRARTAACAA